MGGNNPRWQGHSHEELYRQINAGPGPAASHVPEAEWGGLETVLSQINDDINTGLQRLGASWEGLTAEQTQAGLTPLGQWAQDAQTGTGVMKISAVDQANYIADARNNMPKPVQVTAEAPGFWDKMGAYMAAGSGDSTPLDQLTAQQTDHEHQEAAKNAAELKAYDVMQTYQASSTWNTNTLGTFTPPPSVVMDVPPPAGGFPSGTPVNSPGAYGWTPPGTGGTGGGPVRRPSGPGAPGGWTPPPGGQPGPVNPPPLRTTPVGTNPVGGPPVAPPGQYPPPGGRPVGPGGYPGGFPGAMPPGGWGTAGGGSGAGAGRPGMAGEAAGRGNLGRGGVSGVAAQEEAMAARRGMSGAPGGRGGSIMQPAVGGQGQGGKGEEDGEHQAASYLVETNDIFGDDRLVAPPVIGE